MADQKPKVTLGYSRANGRYHVDQIQGNEPTVAFRPVSATLERRIHVGDWLSEPEAHTMGLVADLIVRPFRLEA